MGRSYPGRCPGLSPFAPLGHCAFAHCVLGHVYWGIARSRIVYWGVARSRIAYWGALRRGFERWIVARLVFACLFVVRWVIVQFVVRWGMVQFAVRCGGVQGLVCVRLPRIGLDFCELGHCDWRIVVLAYVPTAQTVIAQGNALGMQCPNARLPRRGNMIDAFVRPVGQRCFAF